MGGRSLKIKGLGENVGVSKILKSPRGFTMVGALVLAAIVLVGTVASIMLFNFQTINGTIFSRQVSADIVASSLRQLSYDITSCNLAFAGQNLVPSSPTSLQIADVFLNGSYRTLQAGAVYGAGYDDQITINTLTFTNLLPVTPPSGTPVGYQANLNITYTQTTSGVIAQHTVTVPLAFQTVSYPGTVISSCLAIGSTGPTTSPVALLPWGLCQSNSGNNLGGSWNNSSGTCSLTGSSFTSDPVSVTSTTTNATSNTITYNYGACGLTSMLSGGSDFYEQCNLYSSSGGAASWSLLSGDGNGYDPMTQCGMYCVRGAMTAASTPPPPSAPVESPVSQSFSPGCAPDCPGSGICMTAAQCSTFGYNLPFPSPTPYPALPPYQLCLASCENRLTLNTGYNFHACVQGCLYIQYGLPTSGYTCSTFCSALGFTGASGCTGTCSPNDGSCFAAAPSTYFGCGGVQECLCQ